MGKRVTIACESPNVCACGKRPGKLIERIQPACLNFTEIDKASSVKEPFDSPDRIFEVRLAAYRKITVFDLKISGAS
jgi:hypothetical protein